MLYAIAGVAQSLKLSRATIVTAFLSLATLLSMSVWFSATAVAPALEQEWNLSSAQAAWLTMMVQLGFVLGTLLSAYLTLADRIESNRLFALSSVAVAVANGMLVFSDGLASSLPLRFLTGALLAGVYPPAMKLASSWFREGRGLAIGAIIGALTFGTAIPHLFGVAHLFEGFGATSWRFTVIGVSFLALCGGLLVYWVVEEGPYAQRAPRFDPKATREVLAKRGLQLTNLGYLGHMWELYAMWTWVPIFLMETFRSQYGPAGVAAAAGASFAVIAAGGPGSLIAGYFSDRWGRTHVVMASLVLSGSCCILVGFSHNVTLTLILCLVWGCAVVADSAQFSTIATELAPRRLVGTALTLQTSMGFLLTTISLQALPVIREAMGWRQAFAMLALGPAVGLIAMWRLRNSPEAGQIAGGGRERSRQESGS
jgi:MFS family permease